MLRLGDNMSDSREVLVVDDAPAAATDNVSRPASSIPQAEADVTLPMTSRDADRPPTTKTKSSSLGAVSYTHLTLPTNREV